MFSLYTPTVVLMVVHTLQDLKEPKKNRRKKHQGSSQKKDRWFRRAQKVSNKWANRDFIMGGRIFGLLPTIDFVGNWAFFT